MLWIAPKRTMSILTTALTLALWSPIVQGQAMSLASRNPKPRPDTAEHAKLKAQAEMVAERLMATRDPAEAERLAKQHDILAGKIAALDKGKAKARDQANSNVALGQLMEGIKNQGRGNADIEIANPADHSGIYRQEPNGRKGAGGRNDGTMATHWDPEMLAAIDQALKQADSKAQRANAGKQPRDIRKETSHKDPLAPLLQEGLSLSRRTVDLANQARAAAARGDTASLNAIQGKIQGLYKEAKDLRDGLGAFRDVLGRDNDPRSNSLRNRAVDRMNRNARMMKLLETLNKPYALKDGKGLELRGRPEYDLRGTKRDPAAEAYARKMMKERHNIDRPLTMKKSDYALRKLWMNYYLEDIRKGKSSKPDQGVPLPPHKDTDTQANQKNWKDYFQESSIDTASIRQKRDNALELVSSKSMDAGFKMATSFIDRKYMGLASVFESVKSHMDIKKALTDRLDNHLARAFDIMRRATEPNANFGAIAEESFGALRTTGGDLDSYARKTALEQIPGGSALNRAINFFKPKKKVE
jgi:hypothetical protein